MASNEKDSPISLLETLSEIDGNLEYFAVAKDGTTYKCTPAQLKDFVLKGETPVVRIPLAVLNLSNSSSSEDILNAFGGKETFIALCEKIYGRDVVCVCQGFASDDENMKTGYVTQAISCKHIDAENAILMFLINIDNVSHRLMINCVDGTASFSKTTVDDASVILLPDDVNSIEQNYSSKQIFDAFGGKDAYNGYVSKITQKSVIKIGDALYAISQVLGSSYTDENNSQLVVQTIAMNVIKYIQVTVTGGTAKAIVGKWNIVDAAKILTKDNTTAYTPTQNYHPATKKYADASSLYKVYNLGLNVADKTGVLLLWEAEKDEYNATVYRGIMMGSLCTIPLNGITQAGGVPLVSMFASFRKIGENNETDFMYARGSSYIRVAPATVIYNNKDYTALQVEVNGEADIMNFVGYFDRPPLLTWVPYREETGSGEVILNEEINNNIDVFATKEFVYSSNVLTKNNTSAYTPTNDYHPSTKKYVDEQMFLLTISDTGHQELVSNQDTTGEIAATKINTVFGSADNFKSVVSQLMANKRLVIKITETERFQPGVIHSYMNTDNGAYELSFDFNYSSLSSTGATLLSKRILIAMNNNYGNFFIVRDIVTSDNLTTLTKKTKSEYDGIGTKDNSTMYAITE
ncbi:hypothetical protein BS162P1_00126 [Bacteroides phage BS162P1]|nr:hypothetical protein BS162P1_00126 [Bacteroides phage BS162P1]